MRSLLLSTAIFRKHVNILTYYSLKALFFAHSNSRTWFVGEVFFFTDFFFPFCKLFSFSFPHFSECLLNEVKIEKFKWRVNGKENQTSSSCVKTLAHRPMLFDLSKKDRIQNVKTLVLSAAYERKKKLVKRRKYMYAQNVNEPISFLSFSQSYLWLPFFHLFFQTILGNRLLCSVRRMCDIRIKPQILFVCVYMFQVSMVLNAIGCFDIIIIHKFIFSSWMPAAGFHIKFPFKLL